MKSAAKRLSAAIFTLSLAAAMSAAGAQQFRAAGEAAAPKGSLLYVTSEAPADIAVYPSSAAGRVKPIATITGPHTGLIRPNAIAVDGTGTSYVVNTPSYKQTGSVTIVSYGNGDVVRKSLLTMLCVRSAGCRAGRKRRSCYGPKVQFGFNVQDRFTLPDYHDSR